VFESAEVVAEILSEHDNDDNDNDDDDNDDNDDNDDDRRSDLVRRAHLRPPCGCTDDGAEVVA